MNGEVDWTDVKSRNILTLEERVRAIREYDRIPVYQKVADIMNCSAKQIRNIVQNRESILLYYASKTGHCQGGFTKHEDRLQKIDLLNEVMFEWIQRTQSREDVGRISTKLIRTIALDVKNHIKIPSFYPNTVWLESFMQQFNMTEEDLINQKVYARCTQSKEHLSLKISDIVEYVKELRDNPQMTVRNPYIESDEPSYDYKADDSPLMFENATGAGDYYSDTQVIYDDDDDDEQTVVPAKVRKIHRNDPKKNKPDEARFIASYEEALRHLKPLEDFVLLEENFRAIGVISQLEAIFRNPNVNQFSTD